MKEHILFTSLIISISSLAQQSIHRLSLEAVVYEYAFSSAQARIETLNYQNELLAYENFRKADLPSITFNISPFSFNRSLVKLQDAADGQYNYVEEYSSNSSIGVNVSQRIGLTGGNLSVSSSIHYLNELSQSRNSFSTVPISFNYSQRLFGNRKTLLMDKNIERIKNEKAILEYCSKICDIQERAMNLFMEVFLADLKKTQSQDNSHSTDTLLEIARVKYRQNNLTEQDFRQIELQSLNDRFEYESAAKQYAETMQTLLTYLSLPYHVEEIVVEIPKLSLPALIDLTEALYYAGKNDVAEQQLEIRRLEAKRNLYTEQLSNRINSDVNFSYGVNQYAASLKDAYRDPTRQQSVSIGLSVPVFQWGINRNRLRIAENTYNAQMISIEQERQQFDDDLKIKVNSYNRSVNLWNLSEKSYELTKQNYHLLTHLFAIGKSSVYELIAAHRELQTSMQKYYNSVHDVWNSFFAIRKVTLYDFLHRTELKNILKINEIS
jgi:outer membrane protein TolC